MVVQLIEAELMGSEDARHRAALLLEKAAIQEERLSKDEEAANTYRECLELKPEDPSILILLEGIYAAKQDYPRLVEVQRLLADAVEDPSLKAHYLTNAGYILEERLKDKDGAGVAFRAAFSLDRRDVLLLTAMKRVAERDGKTEELLGALASEANLLGAYAAPTYLQISKVYERLDRKEDALAALLAARRASNDPLVLAELARIYESQRRFEDLADVLLSWVGVINDESELVAINLRLAALYEEELRRDEDAIGRYRAILAKVPNHAQALAGLGKLYHRNQNWEGLLSAFDMEVQAADDNRQKAARTYKAAEVLEERLGRSEDAISRYNQCLQFQPGYLPAQKALSRLFEKQNRYAELVAMYEQDLLQTADRNRDHLHPEQDRRPLRGPPLGPGPRHQLHDADPGAHAGPPADDPQPGAAVRGGGQVARAHPAARDRGGAGRGHEAVLSIHHRNAEILDDQLKDRAGAIAAYERLLSLSPSYLPALKALGRLYAQDGRWDDLVKMYRAESEISSSAEVAANLIFKIGELQEHKLNKEVDAIASYQEVLTLAPNYFPALRALGASTGARPPGRASSTCSAPRPPTAPIRWSAPTPSSTPPPSGRTTGAAGHGHRGLPGVPCASPPATPPRSAPWSASTPPRGDVKDLVAVLDRETQTASTATAKVSAYVKLARLYLDTLNEPARAAQCCEAALALEPGNLSSLKALERIRASDRPRRAEVRSRLAERVTDTRLRTALRLAAANDQDRGGGGDLLVEHSSGDGRGPDRRAPRVRARARARQAGNWAGLLQLFERRLQAATEPGPKSELAVRIADLCESKLADPPAPWPTTAPPWRWPPMSSPPSRAPAASTRSWATGPRPGRSWRPRAAPPATSAPRWRRSSPPARRASGSSDAEGAIANYRRALERDPLDPVASAGLEELLARSGGAADLATLQERRGEAKLAQRDSPRRPPPSSPPAQTGSGSWRSRPREGGAGPGAGGAARPPRGAGAAGQPVPGGEAVRGRGVLVQRPGAAGRRRQGALRDPPQAGRPLHGAPLGREPGRRPPPDGARRRRPERRGAGAAGGDPLHLAQLDRRRRLPQAALGPGAPPRRPRPPHAGAGADPRRGVRRSAAGLGALPPGAGPGAGRRLGHRAPGGPLREDRQPPRPGADAGRPGHPGAPGRRSGARRLPAAEDRRSLRPPDAGSAEGDRRVPPGGGAGAAERDGARLARGLYMRDAAAGPLAVQEHLHVLRLDPTRIDSLHALFRLWEGLRQTDKAFCAASLLHFVRSANEIEGAFYNDGRNRLPQESQEPIPPQELDALQHPAARTALAEVLRAVGDQFGKLYPPAFEALGVDRKADRLKPDNAVFKAVRAVAQVFGVEEFEVYQAHRGTIALETTEPLAILRRPGRGAEFNAREQKFLFARAVMGLVNKTPILTKLSAGEVADSARQLDPHPPGELLRAGAAQRRDDPEPQARLLAQGAEGAGGARAGAHRGGGAEPHRARLGGPVLGHARRHALVRRPLGGAAECCSATNRRRPSRSPWTRCCRSLRAREDLRAMVSFALSDDFFRLRSKIGLSV